MKSISFKDKIEKEIVETIQSNNEVHDAINNLVKDRFVEKETFDQRFDRILEEMRVEREEGARKWNASQKRWEENNRKWDENQKQWDENNNKWKDSVKDRQENARKWDESQKRWEDNNRKWDESRKQWDENNNKWKDSAKDREENARKWDESQKRWEENNRKWYENQKVINETLASIKIVEINVEELRDLFTETVGSVGSRWGTRSEQSFRNALKGILEEATHYKVLNVIEDDKDGVVFGWPAQVELDIVLTNGKFFIIEIKSSVSAGDVATFVKKAKFYQEKQNKKANALVIISPMIDDKAREFIRDQGIVAYSYASEVDPILLD